VVLPLPAQGLEKSAGQDCSAGSRTADVLLANTSIVPVLTPRFHLRDVHEKNLTAVVFRNINRVQQDN
jgi:hypothetical protein